MSSNLNKIKVVAVLGLALSVAILGFSVPAQANALTIWSAGSNDGYIHYSTYGSWTQWGAWNTSSDTLSVYYAFYPGSPSGTERDYTAFEIPISLLRTGTVTSATLYLYSLGFSHYDDYLNYGSAGLYHLNPGVYSPTGNVSVDDPRSWGSDYSYSVYNTDIPGSGDAGLKSFDVTAAVLADLAATGRNFSTFRIEASRGASGSLYAAEEEGFGPHMLVQGEALPVPIPGTVWLLGSGLIGLAGVRKWRK